MERECVRLGERFQVVGKWTSFVAVESQDGQDKEVEVEPVEGQRFSNAALTSSEESVKKRKSAGFTQMAFGRSAPMAAASSRGLGGNGGGLFRHRRVLMDSSNAEADADEDYSLVGGYDAASYTAQSFGASFASAAPVATSQGAFGYGAAPPPPAPSGGGLFGHNRTNAAPRASTGGAPPRKQLASMAARQSAPALKRAAAGEETADHVNSDSGHETTMRTLIDLQTFSGAWAWSEELLAALGVEKARVRVEEFGGNAEVSDNISSVRSPRECSILLHRCLKRRGPRFVYREEIDRVKLC